jgi:hypothetical protein
MDFNLPEELQRRICFALIPAKSLCWPPKLSHYPQIAPTIRIRVDDVIDTRIPSGAVENGVVVV